MLDDEDDELEAARDAAHEALTSAWSEVHLSVAELDDVIRKLESALDFGFGLGYILYPRAWFRLRQAKRMRREARQALRDMHP